MTTTADHLTTVIHHWDDLAEALDTVNPTWPPAALRVHVIRLDHQLRDDDTVPPATFEYPPEPIGVTAAPLRIDILDAMTDVERLLLGCADYIAAAVQRSPMPYAPPTWPAVDRARRDALADADRTDPRRWRRCGRRTAPEAATWLQARTTGAGGPFLSLSRDHREVIDRGARRAARRVQHALDLADGHRTLALPCACGGAIEIHGGAGATPCARCTGCGAIWSERGVIAA